MSTRRRARPLARGFIAATLLLALSAADAAAPADAAGLLAGFQGWLDGTRRLEARFRQTLVSGAMGAGMSESGRLYLERPGRMRWDYVEPEIKTALIRDGRMDLYLAEDEQMIRAEIDESDLLATLLVGDRRLSEVFDVERLEPAADSAASPRLRLSPRGDPETFEAIVVRLRPRTFSIETLRVLDAAGNETEYAFTDLRRNAGMPDGVFDFTPPPGTEIISSP